MTQPLLKMKGICKAFGATVALRDVSFQARQGEVLALIGENGAGKSTLMKILSGAYSPDAGSMSLGGSEYRPRGPLDALRRGVAMIYQELNLAEDLSVEDNIMLGQEERTFGVLRRGVQRRRVQEALTLLGNPEIKPESLVRNLSIGAQQLVEIARALVANAQLIVFDEPTSSLTARDTEHLFDVIAKLKASGRAVIYISHFLEEIRRIADHYTVLRDGSVTGGGELAGVTESQLVTLMVGRSIDQLFPNIPHEPAGEILSIENLSGRHMPRNASLKLRRGEILGVAGLVGAGRTELIRCIFGLDPVRKGKVRVEGATTGASPRARIRAGLGMVSEDRKTEGLFQTRSIIDNMTLSSLRPYSRFGWLNLRKRRQVAQRWMERLNIKAQSTEQEIQALSGGNQQKVAISRVLHQDADVILLDEPTRGVDVGAKVEIYRLIGEQAALGKAVIFVSSYLPELLAVCDRVAVMSRGQIREIRPTSDWTEHSIMEQAVSAGESEP